MAEEKELNIYEKLSIIQTRMAAPKNQYNSFGKYKYRSCEDILNALKPFLSELGLAIRISDTIEQIGARTYVVARVELIDAKTKEIMSNQAYAREEESKKGMDGSQVTGASSSYARKYALNGMFCIDDTKDSDATNDGKTKAPEQKKEQPKDASKEVVEVENPELVKSVMELIARAEVPIPTILKSYSKYKDIVSFSQEDLNKLKLRLEKTIESKKEKKNG